MRGEEGERAAISRMVLTPIGIQAGQRRDFVESADALGMDGALERLPASQDAQSDVQDADGNFFFMVDYSEIDGPDLIA